jgi:ubiquinone/menaquinone biosynthesis C-methylase UbiE
MDAHRLEFSDASFDLVFGTAILHHLHLPGAAREIHRVLKPGGRIFFIEPLRHNPVGRVIRWATPRARTPEELPLGRPELRLLATYFKTENYYVEMFTVVGGFIAQLFFRDPVNPITKLCDNVDQFLAKLIPALGPYYRSVVITGEKRDHELP